MGRYKAEPAKNHNQLIKKMSDKISISGTSEIVLPVAKSAAGATITALLTYSAPVLAFLAGIATLVHIYFSIKEKQASLVVLAAEAERTLLENENLRLEKQHLMETLEGNKLLKKRLENEENSDTHSSNIAVSLSKSTD